MIYVFGPCTLDTSLYTLYRADKTVRLRPKVFQVLVYLLEHRDRVVSKDELSQQVWPEQFIGNAPLENTIKLVRRAVGDSGSAQQIIQTFYGHGYRFVAHVEQRDISFPDTRHSPLPDTSIQPEIYDKEQVDSAPYGPVLRWEQEELPLQESLFVGRSRELATLYELLGKVDNSQGQVVCIEGEPGVGKSRLLSEFLHGLQGQQMVVLEARCHAVGQGFPLFPVRQLLRQYSGIDAADSSAVMHKQIHQRLAEVGMDSATDAALLLHLLGTKADADWLVAQCPDMVHTQTVASFCRFFLRGSQQQPLIIAIEDVHGIDAASNVYIASLIESLATAPTLLLLTFRPTYQAAWMDTSHLIHLRLAPLTSRHSLRVLHAIVPPKNRLDDLTEEILTKAAGNPRFLEAVSRTVAACDTQPGDVPTTLRAIYLARIAQLPEAPKRLVQIASIFGQSATARLLEKLWEGPEDFQAALFELQRRGLYAMRHDGDDSSCSFPHPLIQEVIYETIPSAHRQALHTVAAQQLEGLDTPSLNEAASHPAFHYVRAGLTEKAVVSLLDVAEQAARCFAHEEAVTALREALAHAAQLSATSEHECLALDVHLRLAHALLCLGRYPESLEQLAPQHIRIEQLQDPIRTSYWALLLARTYCALEDWPHVVQHAHCAADTARVSDAMEIMGQAYHLLAMERYWAEDILTGIDYSKQAVCALAPSKERYRLGLAHFGLALHTLIYGDLAAALEAASEVRAIGEAIGDIQLQACAAWMTGWIEVTRGDWEMGVAACRRSLDQSPDPLDTAFATGWLGYAYLEKGDSAAAVPLLQDAAHRMHQLQRHRLRGLYTTLLGRASLVQNDLDQAYDFARHGLALCREAGYRFGVAWAQRVLGQVALAHGTLTPAEQYFGEALAIFTALPARFEMGQTHLLLLELTHLQGRYEEAAKHVTAALELFATSQAPNYLEHTEHRAHELGIR